ncbi:MAG: methyltransferase domain-containing protein [Spirochaetales bacterium]|nr:methyltransferase domain-containing protein [Spirochaetales bacterium]
MDQKKRNPMKTLFIPSVRKNNGTGHLKRCLALAESLSRSGETCLFFLNAEGVKPAELIVKFPGLKGFDCFSRESDLPFVPDRIIIDNRETSRELWESWDRLAPVLFIDEGGEARDYGSFLIDTLPVLSRGQANVQGSPLIQPMEKGEPVEKDITSVLITFGGEDPAGLTVPVAEEVLRLIPEAEEIGVVQGPLAEDFTLPAGVKLYKHPPRLEPLFSKYDLVITSFGLTPYEAERAGRPVILVNPSKYHERASKIEGFPSAGVGRKGIKRLGQYLAGDTGSLARTERQEREPLSALIGKLGAAPSASCPLCGQGSQKAVERFEDRTFYYCRRCGNYYLVNWNREEEIYDRDYFFGRYKAQYGKTYLEDFESIKTVGKTRLKEIGRFLSSSLENPLLTDLGCAFGPFLAAASEQGYSCRGVEINRDGARWIEENLSVPVIRGSLEEPEVVSQLENHPGDVTTLWYVIEHMPDQDKLLADLNRTLREGGVLAFGTPSGRGISARKNLKAFLRNSPADHYVIYTPQGAKRILARHGFKVGKVKSVGHHPERFFKWVGKKGSFSYNGLMLISRWFSLGDSLEVYAVKKTD